MSLISMTIDPNIIQRFLANGADVLQDAVKKFETDNKLTNLENFCLLYPKLDTKLGIENAKKLDQYILKQHELVSSTPAYTSSVAKELFGAKLTDDAYRAAKIKHSLLIPLPSIDPLEKVANKEYLYELDLDALSSNVPDIAPISIEIKSMRYQFFLSMP